MGNQVFLPIRKAYGTSMKKRTYYWDTISEKIGKILLETFDPNSSVCEIGFSGGHFLAFLNDKGYKKLSGVEIRKEQYNKTLQAFQKENLNINLINADVLDLNHKYDGIFSTGLIQCLDEQKRAVFLKHVSQMSNTAFFTVPYIPVCRNIDSNESVAVKGCKEYPTGNIPYELSTIYDTVRVGTIKKELTHLKDHIIYYICSNM